MLEIDNLKRKKILLMGKDVDAIFEYLKVINDKIETVDDKIEKVDNKVNIVSNKQNDQQVSIKGLEINVDNINKNIAVISTDVKEKVTKIEKRCEEHKTDIETTNKFIIQHDAKEKTILGLRTDIVAWFGLLAGLVAIIANLDKLIH